MHTNFKIYIFSLILLVLVSFSVLLWEYETTPSISSLQGSGIPYAEVLSISATSEGLLINVSIEGSNAFVPTGGSGVVVETGESFQLVASHGSLYAISPLLPAYFNLSHVGIKGEVQGYFYGAPSTIYFLSLVPVKVSVALKVSSVKLEDGVLFVNVFTSSPIPLVIRDFYNVSVADDSTHHYVFFSIGLWNEDVDVPAGDHILTFEFNCSSPGAPPTWIYSNGPLVDNLYTLYAGVHVLYVCPNSESLHAQTLISVFSGDSVEKRDRGIPVVGHFLCEHLDVLSRLGGQFEPLRGQAPSRRHVREGAP